MGSTFHQLAHIFLHSSISGVHILNVARKSSLQVVKVRMLCHGFVSKPHLCVKESVELVCCRLMQSIYALLQPVCVVVLRVELSVQVAQNSVHAVGEAFGATQDLARRNLLRDEGKRILKRRAHHWLRREYFWPFVEYTAFVRDRLRSRELLFNDLNSVCVLPLRCLRRRW